MPGLSISNLFKKKSNTVIGLDIGTYNIKLVNISDQKSQSPKLLSLGSRELPPNAIIDKDIKDREGVVYAIQTIAEELAPDATDVVLNVSGHKIFVDRMQVNIVGKKIKLSEAVMTEAEQRIPMGTAGIAVDYFSLGKTADGKREDVILVAARREFIEDYFGVVRDAGLQPIAIDVDFFSIYNAFEFNYGIPEEGTIAILNIGYNLTNITFTIDGKYYTVREVSSGTRAIWEQLQTELRLSPDDQKDLVKGDYPIEDKGQYRAAIYAATEELKLGIDVAFGFIENATGGRKVDKMFICGGGALIDGVPEALERKTSIIVELLDPLKKFDISGITGDQAKKAPLYASAIGLALRA